MSEQLEDVSVATADAAQTFPGPAGASEVQKTNEAVAEGQASTQGYVQQARELAGSALATAAVSHIDIAHSSAGG